MKNDILTVMWKERKSLFRFRDRRSQALLSLLSPAFLAIYLPWEAGQDWVEGYVSLMLAAIIPVILVGITIPDSFAGERERHTLGTLLASRLSDRVILFGKVAVAVSFGWGFTLIVLLLALVTVNVTHWDGQVLLYSPKVAATWRGGEFPDGSTCGERGRPDFTPICNSAGGPADPDSCSYASPHAARPDHASGCKNSARMGTKGAIGKREPNTGVAHHFGSPGGGQSGIAPGSDGPLPASAVDSGLRSDGDWAGRRRPSRRDAWQGLGFPVQE